MEPDVPPFLLLIGPQASGKSTVTKLLYFFSSPHEELAIFAFENYRIENEGEPEKTTGRFANRIARKFKGLLGDTADFDGASVATHAHAADKTIAVTIADTGAYSVAFSEALFGRGLHGIFDKVRELNALPIGNNFEKARESRVEKDVSRLIASIFGTYYERRCVPAGRSLLSAVSASMQSPLIAEIGTSIQQDDEENSPVLHENRPSPYATRKKQLYLDPIVLEFMDRREQSKGSFAGLFPDGQHMNPFAAITMSRHQQGILRARYRVERDGTERIYFGNGRRIRTGFASSGQQESLGTLSDLLTVAQADNQESKPSLVTVEEPEAHLYAIVVLKTDKCLLQDADEPDKGRCEGAMWDDSQLCWLEIKNATSVKARKNPRQKAYQQLEDTIRWFSQTDIPFEQRYLYALVTFPTKESRTLLPAVKSRSQNRNDYFAYTYNVTLLEGNAYTFS